MDNWRVPVRPRLGLMLRNTTSRTWLRLVALVATAILSTFAAHEASAQEPAACLSFDPAAWPPPARPYFHLVVDTSGSMTACTTPPTNYPVECNQNAPGYA